MENKNDMKESIVSCNGESFALLPYVPAAKITRVNFGWRRRKDKQIKGFLIDPLSGYWSKEGYEDDDDEEKPGRRPPQRVVPYVEDTKNILIFKPNRTYGNEEIMPTLQAALKRGIETYYEPEESEIAAEPLPSTGKRNSILFYEASEGGAGVLKHLTGDPLALLRIARKALEIMHYDEGGNDLGKDCVAACYDCLLSYYNQPEHILINRRNKAVLEILNALGSGEIVPQTNESHKDHSENSPAFGGGTWKADEYYKDERKAVFYSDPGKEAKDYFEDRGFVVEIKEKGDKT
jgi:hypothetical protein